MGKRLIETDNYVSKVLVERGVSHFAMARHIMKNLHGLPREQAGKKTTRKSLEDTGKDREVLELTLHGGEFLKPCPGTKGYICCGYQILNVGSNCPLNCSYCILQAYFDTPTMKIFVNLEESLGLLGQAIDSQPNRFFRIGTGEFTDSLALDPIVGWSDILLPFFSTRKNTVLELKTKTTHIAGLLSSKYRERIVVSWSLNSPFITATEEHGAPTLKRRLEAAGKCQEEGFVLGFHFDPLIMHPNWKAGYARTIEMMDRYIDPKRIMWISLGCFRYMPNLKRIVRARYPETRILAGEFIKGLDGKMRYFKPLRIDMYAFLSNTLKKWHKDLECYLCMESDDVWHKSLGWSPKDSDGLSYYLDNRVKEMLI